MYNTKISEIMSTDLETLLPDDSMEKVDKLFKTNSFHHLPVVDNANRVVGIISKSNYHQLQDSFTYFCKKRGEERNARLFKSLIVEEVMTRSVATLQTDSTVGLAAGMFKENDFHAIPVTNEDGFLVGIVTTYDLLNYAFP